MFTLTTWGVEIGQGQRFFRFFIEKRLDILKRVWYCVLLEEG